MNGRIVPLLALLAITFIIGRALALQAAQVTPAAPPPDLAFIYYNNWWTGNSFSAAAATYRTVSGDFNGDGLDDITMVHRRSATTVRFYVLLGTGNESFAWQGIWFQASGYLTADMMTGRVIAGDFNNDGYDDVAAFAGSTQTLAYVFVSNGSSFSDEIWWTGALDYQDKITGRVVAGDFDGDGWKDDIAALYDAGGAGTRLDLFTSDGVVFSEPEDRWSNTGFDAGRTTNRVIAGDFDGDGWKDDVAAIYDEGNNMVRAPVWISAGSTVFASWWNHAGYDPDKVAGRVVAGDFDGDGDDDVSLLYEYPNNHIRAHLLLADPANAEFAYQGNDPGWWDHTSYVPSHATGRVVAGDWDGNGVDDVSMIYEYTASVARAQVLEATALPPGPATTRQVDKDDPACDDSSGEPYCTIQAAVYAANDGDTIALSAGTYLEHVTVPRYDVAGFNQYLTITGAGAGQTFVDGDNGGRVFMIYGNGQLKLGFMTIQNGQMGAAFGGGVYNAGELAIHDATIIANVAVKGGGIASVGDLDLRRVFVSANTAEQGGGVYTTGFLTIEDSQIYSNTATMPGGGALGGGIRTFGGVTRVTSSTFHGNYADGTGGAISHGAGLTGGRTTVFNSTISGNAAAGGGGLHNYNSDLNIFNSTVANNSANNGRGVLTIAGGTTRFWFTIIAQAGNDNCYNYNDGSSTASRGYNLSNDLTCSLDRPTDLPGKDPQLGPLQNNGGSTLTHALAEGSPAVDVGAESCGDALVDQRGLPRPQDGDGDGTATCDIGAFEYGWWTLYLPSVVRP